jgi:rubrerythrin
MDMLHFALAQELQTEQYYRQLALISPSNAVKEIFLKMADAEHTHVMALQEYERSHNVCMTPFEYDDCCDCIRMLEASAPDEAVEAVMDLYEAAWSAKWQEEQFYVNASVKTEVPLEKMLFTGLRKDEERGAILIDRLCSSMSRQASLELAIA